MLLASDFSDYVVLFFFFSVRTVVSLRVRMYPLYIYEQKESSDVQGMI